LRNTAFLLKQETHREIRCSLKIIDHGFYSSSPQNIYKITFQLISKFISYLLGPNTNNLNDPGVYLRMPLGPHHTDNQSLMDPGVYLRMPVGARHKNTPAGSDDLGYVILPEDSDQSPIPMCEMSSLGEQNGTGYERIRHNRNGQEITPLGNVYDDRRANREGPNQGQYRSLNKKEDQLMISGNILAFLKYNNNNNNNVHLYSVF